MLLILSECEGKNLKLKRIELTAALESVHSSERRTIGFSKIKIIIIELMIKNLDVRSKHQKFYEL